MRFFNNPEYFSTFQLFRMFLNTFVRLSIYSKHNRQLSTSTETNLVTKVWNRSQDITSFLEQWWSLIPLFMMKNTIMEPVILSSPKEHKNPNWEKLTSPSANVFLTIVFLITFFFTFLDNVIFFRQCWQLNTLCLTNLFLSLGLSKCHRGTWTEAFRVLFEKIQISSVD